MEPITEDVVEEDAHTIPDGLRESRDDNALEGSEEEDLPMIQDLCRPAVKRMPGLDPLWLSTSWRALSV